MQGDLSFAKRKASARDGVVADAAVLFVRFFCAVCEGYIYKPILGWDSLFIVITFYSFSESALGLRAQVVFLNTEEI